MTLEEYLGKTKMTQKEMAQLLGVTPQTIRRHIQLGTRFSKPKVVHQLTELGIDVELFRPRGKHALSEYLYQEKLYIEAHPKGEIYAYSLERVNEVRGYLNRRRISYYVRMIEACWVIKYDTTYKEGEWTC